MIGTQHHTEIPWRWLGSYISLHVLRVLVLRRMFCFSCLSKRIVAANTMIAPISLRMFYIIASLQLLTYLSLANNCYYPHGNVALADVVCFPSSADSFCCGLGYACLENKLCMRTAEGTDNQPIGTLDRGSCTDQSFNSSACPQFCTDAGSKHFIRLSTKKGHSDNISSKSGRWKCGYSVLWECLLLWWR